MPRPMTTYDPGIQSVTRTLDEPCLGCGKVQHRERIFTGTDGEIDAQHAAWLDIPVWCIPCWRKAGRPQ